jgi:hypothetical protein
VKTWIVLAIAGAVLAQPLTAKPHKHPPQKKPAASAPAPAATPAPPPASAPPSAQLQYFFDIHLNDILGPIDAKIPPLPTNQLTQLKENLKDGLAAAPDARKPIYQAAIGVCDALDQAMTEREKHAVNLQSASVHSADPAPADRTVNRRVGAVNDLLITTKTQWSNRAVYLRKVINTRYAQEREAERTAPAEAPPK